MVEVNQDLVNFASIAMIIVFSFLIIRKFVDMTEYVYYKNQNISYDDVVGIVLYACVIYAFITEIKN